MPGKRKDARDILANERAIQALEMRKRAMSFRDIGAVLGVSHSTAFNLVMAAVKRLNEIEAETAEEYRRVELERLDAVLASVLPRALDTTDKGHLAAIDRVLSIGEQRAKLLGLNAPTKQDVTAEVKRILVRYESDSSTPVETAQRTAADPA